MNKKLLEYIKSLSLDDPKDLVGKALKTSDEAGAISRKVLEYIGAPGSMHTFVGKRDVLHEVVDTILCSLSIAYDLGFSDEEIESMMVEQCAKWRQKQFKEKELKDPSNIPYEIHITIANERTYKEFNPLRNEYGNMVTRPITVDKFKDICEQINVKPIILDLQDKDGNSIMEDYQTSSVFFGTNKQALDEVDKIVQALEKYHVKVLRKKIETVPWHPAAPSDTGIVKEMPKDCYFEVHFNVILPIENKAMAKHTLSEVAKKLDAHLSRNTFKKLKDGRETVMMTYRTKHGVRENFTEYIEEVALPCLKRHGFEVEKVIPEFSIYDSKINHDAAWIG